MRKPVAKRFQDIRPGDVVCEKEGEYYEIERCGSLLITHPNIHLYIKDKGLANLYGHPDQIIGLLYRPWPEGKTEMDMLRNISFQAFWTYELKVKMNEPWVHGGELPKKASPELDEAITKLHELIEVYELGKPLDKAPTNLPLDVEGYLGVDR